AWLGAPEGGESSKEAVWKKEPEPTRALVVPLLEKPTAIELASLSLQRSIALDALRIAVDRDFLWTYSDRAENVRPWLLTDSALKLAIARRLDGILWANGRKSKNLYGSWGHWPIGITEAANYPAIGLVEGTPDFLALIAQAWSSHVEDRVAPVCIAGA